MTMPCKIDKVKDFLLTARPKDAKSPKVQCSRYLHHKEKAEKMKQPLPLGLAMKELK
ncbi:unnamed protein product [Nyctereutes procyonoides]|uniref:Large ribosomal subunit protein eL38 n=1 Tax=Nyctereutes procyonoides TaxID=34880 RepID=A0A811YPC9_NYCPR|nr:unnamed protein product [Nyctereutes procyonoides]CAD7688139.1 unnamed protein product [Nyctereutes procyonoides]